MRTAITSFAKDYHFVPIQGHVQVHGHPKYLLVNFQLIEICHNGLRGCGDTLRLKSSSTL